MPRVRLNNKFTYSNDAVYVDLHAVNEATLKGRNGNLYTTETIPYDMLFPVFNFPQLGNNHDQRHGNRITITSVRYKTMINLNPIFLTNSSNGPFSSGATDGTTSPPKRFFKFRYMLVQWDDDIANSVDEVYIFKWFLRSYCWAIPPTRTEEPIVAADYSDAPVSVHSNLLHETTEYIAKFNILCDKCLTLTNTKQQISLDITVPLNKTYCFDEDNPNLLLYPHLTLFILPPLNGYTDIDPLSLKQMLAQNRLVNLCTCYNFTKLNFIDL